MAHRSAQQSTLPTQSAWAGVGLMVLAMAYQMPALGQPMGMVGGLFGLLAGLGLEQTRKRERAASQCAMSVQQHIMLQTGGHVHDLSVRFCGSRACVEGYTSSYHWLQQARFAATEVLGTAAPTDLDFKIRVKKPR